MKDEIFEYVAKNGVIYKFDADMREKIEKQIWYVDTYGYLVNNNIKAHQLVIGKAPTNMVIDHKDRDKTNCLRNNLKFVTHKVNSRNRGLPKNNTTGFKGVTLDKRCGKYHARITIDGKNKHLGTFKTALEAAKCYDMNSIFYFGSIAVTNEDLGLINKSEKQEYDKKFVKVLQDMEHLARGKKTNDYNETWKRLGLIGLYLKIFIKEGRLNQLVWKGVEPQVADESVKDTLRDLACYAVYGLIALEEGNINGEADREKHERGMLNVLLDRLGEHIENSKSPQCAKEVNDENTDNKI